MASPRISAKPLRKNTMLAERSGYGACLEGSRTTSAGAAPCVTVS
jgi:hypothetical protein